MAFFISSLTIDRADPQAAQFKKVFRSGQNLIYYVITFIFSLRS